MKKTNKALITMAFAAAVAQPAAAIDLDLIEGVDTSFYGSFRMQLENVRPDNEVPGFSDYTSVRDAYSRVGFKASTSLNDDITFTAQYEQPLDLAKGDANGPLNQNDKERVAKLQLSGDWGRIWIGEDWLPYYNAIAYKVDLFDSYYSGFATFAAFRRDETIGFNLPVAGFDVSGAYSKGNYSEGDDGVESRKQLAVSKTMGNLTVAVAVDDVKSDSWSGDLTYYGIGAGYTTGPWYIGAKYETVDSDVASGWLEDGSSTYNIFASYTVGLHTYAAGVSQIDNFGETLFQAEWTYKFHPQARVFVDYYQEEENAAIAPERDSTYAGDWVDSSGGQVVLVGIRYDF